MTRFRVTGILVFVVLAITGCRPQENLDLIGFVDLLTEQGARVVELDPGDRLIPWFGGTQHRLCVDDQTVWVLEYPDPASRRRDSDGVADDASRIGPGYLEINGRFRVWAEGRLLVLYLGLDDKIVRRISDVLGDTITPHAEPRGPFGGQVDARRAARDYSCMSS